MNILLLGATGRVGHSILQRAIADHHHVKALVRSPEKLTIQSDYLTVHKGNVLHKENLMQAMTGADIVISALNTDKNQTLSRSMPLIIQAMEAHNVKRIITIGTAGILNSRTQPELYRFQSNESKRRSTTAAEDHLSSYQYLAASALDWTIICPTYLPDGIETGEYRIEENVLPEAGKKISVEDTAAFAYAQLSQKEFINKRVGIAY